MDSPFGDLQPRPGDQAFAFPTDYVSKAEIYELYQKSDDKDAFAAERTSHLAQRKTAEEKAHLDKLERTAKKELKSLLKDRDIELTKEESEKVIKVIASTMREASADDTKAFINSQISNADFKRKFGRDAENEIPRLVSLVANISADAAETDSIQRATQKQNNEGHLVPIKQSAADKGIANSYYLTSNGEDCDDAKPDASIEASCESDVDSDRDGLFDKLEKSIGTNENDADTDDDGLSDGFEVIGTPQHEMDKGIPAYELDADGVPFTREKTADKTYAEFKYKLSNPLADDTDGDGLRDKDELTLIKDNPLNPRDPDMDKDGISDGVETAANAEDLANYHPTVVKSDDDALPDVLDTNSDNDGQLDSAEGPAEGVTGLIKNFPSLKKSTIQTDQPAYRINDDMDSDKDGLSDVRENEIGTKANNADTDGDGISDGGEVFGVEKNPMDQGLKFYAKDPNGTSFQAEGKTAFIYLHSNPLDADTDDDNIRDRVELTAFGDDQLNPRNDDTDGDFISDGIEGSKNATDLAAKKFGRVDTDSDGKIDALDENSDSDGYLDYAEAYPEGLSPRGVIKSYDKLRASIDLKTTPAFRATRVKIVGNKIEIADKIYFDVDKDTIKEESFSLLDEIAAIIASHPELKLISVEGHADEQGPDAYNLDLSQRRVNSVKTYLEGKGIDPNILEAVGHGEKFPIDKGHNENAWKKNRRVEFIIKERGENIKEFDATPVQGGGSGSATPTETTPKTDEGESGTVMALTQLKDVGRKTIEAVIVREGLKASGYIQLQIGVDGKISDYRSKITEGSLPADFFSQVVRHLNGKYQLDPASARAGRLVIPFQSGTVAPVSDDEATEINFDE